jgi:HSP20 family protein
LFRTPLTNIKESDSHFNLIVELPGLDKKDVAISFQGGILEIKGEKSEKVKKEKEEKKDKDKEKKEKHKEKEKDKKKEKKEKFKVIEGEFIRREFRASTFYRTFSLPEEIESEGIKAKFDNGILILKIPKEKPEGEEKQVIPIE